MCDHCRRLCLCVLLSSAGARDRSGSDSSEEVVDEDAEDDEDDDGDGGGSHRDRFNGSTSVITMTAFNSFAKSMGECCRDQEWASKP